MGDKRVVSVERNHQELETPGESVPSLARGSNKSLSAETLSAVSQPRRPSRAPLSAFQLPEAARTDGRTSSRELPPAQPANARPYLAAVVALLACTVAVLVLLLVS